MTSVRILLILNPGTAKHLIRKQVRRKGHAPIQERESITNLFSRNLHFGRFGLREQERKLKYIMYVERNHTYLRVNNQID